MSSPPVDGADDELDLHCEPVDEPAVRPGVDATVAVVPIAGDDGPEAMVLASMRRLRLVEHEEVWAQLFVDDRFVDAVRGAEVDSTSADLEWVTFVARFELPKEQLDGSRHRARVAFSQEVSRVVPRGQTASLDGPATEAVAATDFTAILPPAELHRRAG